MKYIQLFEEFINESLFITKDSKISSKGNFANKFYSIGWYDNKTLQGIKKEKIFKLGKIDNQKNQFKEDPNYDPNYEGGIVFKNLNEIKDYCIKTNVKNFKDLYIFELKDCIEKDIYKHSDGFYYLLHNKKLIYLDKYNELF